MYNIIVYIKKRRKNILRAETSYYVTRFTMSGKSPYFDVKESLILNTGVSLFRLATPKNIKRVLFVSFFLFHLNIKRFKMCILNFFGELCVFVLIQIKNINWIFEFFSDWINYIMNLCFTSENQWRLVEYAINLRKKRQQKRISCVL